MNANAETKSSEAKYAHMYTVVTRGKHSRKEKGRRMRGTVGE